MSDIPIFDSLTHPTLNGDWILPKYQGRARLNELETQMEVSNVRWAFAVGMRGIGDYDGRSYLEFVRSSSKCLLPVAYFDYKASESAADVKQRIRRLKKLGYLGIKLHLRFSRIRLTDKILPQVIKRAADAQMPVLLCTYRYCRNFDRLPNSFDDFLSLLSKVSDCPIILMHGGDVNLLQMMEVARAFTNVLVDLSFTLLKYEGSSLDLDVRHLFEHFDRRICIGSDHPEFSLADLRRRFNHFAEGLDTNKATNIAYRNIAAHAALNLTPRS